MAAPVGRRRRQGARLQDWACCELADLAAAEYDGQRTGLWTRGLLIRRNIADGDLAFFTTWRPAGTDIETLVKVEGHRWAIEDSFETAKIELGRRRSQDAPRHKKPRASFQRGGTGSRAGIWRRSETAQPRDGAALRLRRQSGLRVLEETFEDFLRGFPARISCSASVSVSLRVEM
jgi:hypothetical protein